MYFTILERVKLTRAHKKTFQSCAFQFNDWYLSYHLNYDEKLAYSLDDIRDSDVMSCIKKYLNKILLFQ